jgi:hypothetical protein
MSDVPSPTLSSMTGDMNCETGSQPINTPDLTKYLIASSQGSYERHYVYRACEPCQLQDYPTYGSVSRFCSVDQNTGKKTYGGYNSGDYTDATAAIPNLRLADLPGIYRERIESILPNLKGLPGPDGPVDVTPTFSADGGVPSVTWLYNWDIPGGGDENGAPCSTRRDGFYSGTISLDLAAGTFTYIVNRFDRFRETCDDGTSGSSWESSSRTETISMTATTVSRQTAWNNRSGNDGGCESGIEDDWGNTSGSVSYTAAYTSDQVNSDTDTLLSKWNLLDDIEYPWRSDGDTSSGPLVTQNERGATAPDAVFDLINVGTQEAPVWQLPTDTSLPPWPSQPEAAVLGAPLPVHGPSGELYAYEPYYNFYHKNWTFEDTGRGSPQGFIDSYGAPSPYPNATQWLDKDEARCFPAGPFWAYGSEIEGGGDHFMFRFKDPYITDTDNEWEQGGYGGGCLIKCKWAETISPVSPQGEDFVFKQWHYNFRDFISSYYWNVGAWSRNNIEIPGGSTCTPLSFVPPVRYTPIDIPYPSPLAGYYIGPGSWYVSQMDCTAVHAGSACCQTAVYVEPNPPGSACNNGAGDGVFVAMPAAVCDARFGSLWMGRADQSVLDAHSCDNYVANRNNGVANPEACEPQIYLEPVFHSHNHAYELWVEPLGFPVGGGTPNWVDLDIDSDNNNGFNPPDRSSFEDEIEDSPALPGTPGLPGKIMPVNDKDSDGDTIPGFADGFNLTGDGDPTNPDYISANDKFVPLVLEISKGVDLSKAHINITYSDCDPEAVWFDGNAWQPGGSGNLRIWKKDGSQHRNPASANASGDYVPSGTYNDPTKLGFSSGNRIVTLYVEGIRPSTEQGDQRISVELDDGTGTVHSKKSDAVRITVVKVHLDVDTDRDGIVDEQKDDHGKDTWTSSRGAIFSVNLDADCGRTSDGTPNGFPIPDSIYIKDDGTPDYESLKIEDPINANADDTLDLAPMVIRKIGVLPQGMKVFLKAENQENVQRVHIYKKIAVGETAIWGNATGSTPPMELDITKWIDPQSPDFSGDPGTGDATFGIEGMFFRYQGANVPAPLKFSGEIGFTIEFRMGSTVVGSDKVHLKVAPWIACTHGEASTQVWAAKASGFNNTMLNNEFLHNSSAEPGYKGLDDSNQLPPDNYLPSWPDSSTPYFISQWIQDHVQFGYTQRPGGPKKYIVLRMPYPYSVDLAGNPVSPQPKWPLTSLLYPGIGVYQIGESFGKRSGDYGGNLEVVPPSSSHPLGQVCMGDTSSLQLQQFLSSQEYQPAFFDLPSSWLFIGHIDEVSSFAGGNYVIIADPVLAWNLISDPSNIPTANRHAALFFATGATPQGGTVSSGTATRLYDGPATGQIVTVGEANLIDGDKFTIKQDATTSRTFEFNLTGTVGPGNIAIDLTSPGLSTADQVRDLIVSAINGSGLSVNAIADGPATIHLWNTTKGTAGNQAITKTVANSGFGVSGMSGGKDDGRNFVTGPWGFVRTFTYDIAGKPSNGQVARIKSGGLHDGWIEIDRVWMTTSKLIDGTAPGQDIAFWADVPNPLPTTVNWDSAKPKWADKYCVCQDTRRWFSGLAESLDGFRTPAIISVEEVLADSNFQALNLTDIQGQLNSFKTTLNTHFGSSMNFASVPALFLGSHTFFGQQGHKAFAFNPGPTNLQPLNGKRYVPRQFAPKSAVGVDIYEARIRNDLGPAPVEFIDCWNLYHRLTGEVHCGSEVFRGFGTVDWWTTSP